MKFDDLYNQLLEARKISSLDSALFELDDIVQLKHAALTIPTAVYKDHQPGDQFKVIGRVPGTKASRSFYVQSVDTGKKYSVPGYHIQSINTPLVQDFQHPKRLTGDITCANCGKVFDLSLKGSKHRDHCPHCLCSLHVDTKPGVRKAWCGTGEYGSSDFKSSILRPIARSSPQLPTYIKYQCEKCGKEKINIQAFDDNQELLDQLPVMSFQARGYKI